MIQRFAISISTGVVITFALLWLMQVLIATGRSAIVDQRDFKFVDFVRIKKEELLNTDEDDFEKPPEPDTPPPEMPQQQMDNLDTSQTMGVMGFDANFDIDGPAGGGFAIVDGDYLPIVKVAPIYPRRAMSRGLEGQCLLEFTVTTLGTVSDPRVVECSSSLFASASVNAALKFKYKPRVVDGEPIEVPGVQHLITYKLED